MNKNKLYPWQLQRVADALEALTHAGQPVSIKMKTDTLFFYVERDGKLESLVGVSLGGE